MSGTVWPPPDGSPDFDQLKLQSTYLNVVQDSAAHPELEFGTCSIMEGVGLMYDRSNLTRPSFDLSDTALKHSVMDDHLLLAGNTEVSYKLPPHTSLVEVLGPVGTHSAWTGRGRCYATLNPSPLWNGATPYSTSVRNLADYNLSNQTMFLFPMSPNQNFTLRIGNLGPDTTCALNGIRTYPFHL